MSRESEIERLEQFRILSPMASAVLSEFGTPYSADSSHFELGERLHWILIHGVNVFHSFHSVSEAIVSTCGDRVTEYQDSRYELIVGLTSHAVVGTLFLAIHDEVMDILNELPRFEKSPISEWSDVGKDWQQFFAEMEVGLLDFEKQSLLAVKLETEFTLFKHRIDASNGQAIHVSAEREDLTSNLVPFPKLHSADRDHVALEIDPVPSNVRDNGTPQPWHASPDYRTVTWYGDAYSFTPNQADVVKKLLEAWCKGIKALSKDALISGGDMRDVFKGHGSKAMHPAWKTMIGPVPKRRGMYQLIAPE